MLYKNKKNNRIQDYQQINYVKNILEIAAVKCQQAGMHDPTIYHATAQRIADTNSLNDPSKPRITFDTKQQKIKGQQEPVLELTATISDRTSTSYFLVKDSAAPGSKPTSEQLIYLRPDVVSARIQASLGLTSAAGATNSTNTQSVSHAIPVNRTMASPTPSKAQILAQSMEQPAPTPLQTPTPPQPVASNPLADKLAALANPVFSSHATSTQANAKPMVNSQKVSKQDSLNSSDIKSNHLPPPPPDQVRAINKTTKTMQTIGKVNTSLGQALKDMAEGEINPVQLYGYALEAMGNFINGIPAGIHEARLKQIASKIDEIEQERTVVDRLMKETGDTVLQWEKNELSSSKNQSPTPASGVFPTLLNTNKVAPVASQIELEKAPQPKVQADKPAQTKEKIPEQLTAIDKLLQANLPIEDKLDAIEKTLDEMLKELTAMRVSLEATQAAVQAEIEAAKTPAVNAEGRIVESQAKTEVEVVANTPKSQVPFRTEIDTDLVAEAKTQTEAAKEVEVPQVEVDSTAESGYRQAPPLQGGEPVTPNVEINISEELAEAISSYQGDITKLNKHLKPSNLKITLSEDGSTLAIKEIQNNLASTVFTAQCKEDGWSIDSRINDSVKLDILTSFYKAEELTKSDLEANIQRQTDRASAIEQPSLELI